MDRKKAKAEKIAQRTILVVDGQPNSLHRTVRILTEAGYRTLHACTGEACLQTTYRDRPDLILLTTTLPDLDSIEVCKQIKADPHLTKAYVILFSMSDMDTDIPSSSWDAYIDGYIRQTNSTREFLSRIRAFMRLKSTEEALRESQHFLQSVLDSMAPNIAVLDQEGTITAVNASWCQFGRKNDLSWSDHGIGHNYLTVLDAATGEASAGATEAAQGIRDVIAGRRERYWQEYPCHSPGEQRWYAMWVTRFPSNGGVRVVISHQDVTEQKIAEMALHDAKEIAEQARQQAEMAHKEEEQRRRIAEGLRDIVTVLNSNKPLPQVLEFIAVQVVRLLESQAAAIYQAQNKDKAPILRASYGLSARYASTANYATGIQTLQQALVTQQPVTASNIPTPDGAGPYRAMMAVPIPVENQIYGGMVLYHIQPWTFSEEQIGLASTVGDQIALAIENARLRDQVEQTAVETERNRLARDLHDAVTQTLFSASIIAESLPRIWKRYPDEAQRGLEELRQLTRGALAEMRTLLLELRPAALTEKPLGDLLRHLIEATTSRTRVPISLNTHGNTHLSPRVQIVLYRIAQEVLNNVAKHAQAGQVNVELDVQETRVRLYIQDDGRGFDPQAIPAGHLGIGIMRERVESIGATLEIDSRPGQGTKVTVVLEKQK